MFRGESPDERGGGVCACEHRKVVDEGPYLVRLRGILDGWCERVGRYPNQIERSVLIWSNRIKNADAYVENGINHLMLGFTGLYHDLSPLQELIARRDSRNSS